MDRRTDKDVVHTHNGLLLSREKEPNHATCLRGAVETFALSEASHTQTDII